jgi:hypothetical protein
VAEGHCTKDVARMLAMSVKTAETHRSNILRKLQVHTTAELILYAVRNQIVHIEHAPQELCVLPFAKPAHSTSQASSQLAATA